MGRAVRPLRGALIEWLGRVGDRAAHCDDDPVDDLAAYRECRQIRGELRQGVAPFVWARMNPFGRRPSGPARQLLRAPDLAEFRHALAEALLHELRR